MPHRSRSIVFRSVHEPQAGAKWRGLFGQSWESYSSWFLSEGDHARPSYHEASRALARHMPELVPVYEQLVDLAGGGDRAARMLTLYRPPAYMTGCSQIAWAREEPALLRNYDYVPDRCEGTILQTAWLGQRVIAMSDCLWGALDGVNESGLAVSLSFGGRPEVGEGFGIPLVLRYVLEVCQTTREAARAVARIPVHMSYNVTLVDKDARAMTLYVAPDREPVMTETPFCTNHQGRIEWDDLARVNATLEREQLLAERWADPHGTLAGMEAAMLRPPLFVPYARGWGTLYTAAYYPARGGAAYRWPGTALEQSLDGFVEGETTIRYTPGAVTPA